jgi:hypothetical protein
MLSAEEAKGYKIKTTKYNHVSVAFYQAAFLFSATSFVMCYSGYFIEH